LNKESIHSFIPKTIMSLTNALPEDAAKAAKSASHILATLPTSARNDALTAIHSALSASKDEIVAANARDLALAQKAAENGELSSSIVSRLDLAKKGKWEDMLKGILDVRELEDPGMSTAVVRCIRTFR
jgi:glutamate-5-semialdehyde dehydrogenase